MKHELLEEIWTARRRIAQENGYSLRRTVAYLRRLEADYPGRVVAFEPRKPDPIWLEPLPRVRSAARRQREARAPALREEPPPYGQKQRRKS